MRSEGSGIAGAIVVFILIVLIIISLLYFLDIVALIISIIGLVCMIGLIVGVIVIGIATILATGYFFVTKDPEIQTNVNYYLDETIDSEDLKKK